MQLSNNEFYIIMFGWVVAVFLMFTTILLVKFTPAKIFLKAWFSKSAICWVKFRTGMGEFRIAKQEDPGSVTVKDLGFVQMVEGSQVIERNSKVPVYDVFAEYGASIPKEYPAIIQELREEGFVINTFADYAHLVKLSADQEYASEHLEKITDAEEKKIAQERIQHLRDMDILIKPYKAYKVHELAFMFPNNISPVYVDAKVTNAVTRQMKKMQMSQQMLIYVAIAVLILVISVVLIFKLVKVPEVPPISVSCAQAGLQTAQGAVNATLGI